MFEPLQADLFASTREDRESSICAQELTHTTDELDVCPNCANRYKTNRCSKIRPICHVFGPLRFYENILESERPDSFPQERGLSALRLDHRQLTPGFGDLQRNRWRSTSGSDVDPGRPGWIEMSGGSERLDQQAIECVVGRIVNRNSRQVNRFVPASKEREVGLELLQLIGRNLDSRVAGPP